MSYTRPAYNAVSFDFSVGAGYTRPAYNAVAFSFPADVVSGIGAVTLGDLVVVGVGAHGVAGAGAVTLDDLVVAGVGEHEGPEVVGVGAVTLDDLIVVCVGAHGVAGAGAVVLGAPAVAGDGAHGVSGTGAVTLSDLIIGGIGAHGVAGTGSVTLGGLIAAGVALHPRYSLKGEVRDGGVLVNRRVRVYPLDTGELFVEQDTVAGAFDIHAGFTERMFYLTPIDMTEDAADFRPPTANRILSTLAMD